MVGLEVLPHNALVALCVNRIACVAMTSDLNATPAFASALRQELLVSSKYLNGNPLCEIDEVLSAASELSEPWWNLSLDVRTQRSVTRRLATFLVQCIEFPRPLLRATQLQVQHEPIHSIGEQWTRLVVSRAVALEVSFPEVIRLATSDALWMARTEIDGDKSTHPIELAVVYDSMVLTGAYGVLHSVAKNPDSRTLETASNILGHAALVAHRSEDGAS